MSNLNTAETETSEKSTATDTVSDTTANEHTLQSPVEGPEELSVDVIFEVLNNQRRRRVVQYLRTNEGPATLGAVAEYIAGLENNKDEKLITYAERKRVYVGLYQCHLPKMDDMGVVDFNRARGRIEMTDQTLDLVPYIEGPVSRRPWHLYYGALVIGGLALFVTTLANVLPGVLTIQLALGAILFSMTVCIGLQCLDETDRDLSGLSFV